MDLINLIIENPVEAIALASLAFNWFLIRRNQILSEKTGPVQSALDAKNKEIECFISERKQTEKEQKEAIVNINKKYDKELALLRDEIKSLNEIIYHNNNPINFESEW